MSGPHGLLHNLTLLLLPTWILLAVTFVVPTTAKALEDEFEWKELPTRTASQCFNVQGVPVVTLRCNRGELIRVLQAFYGADPDPGGSREKESGDRPRRCSYDRRGEDCVQFTNLKENCNGKSICTLAVSNPFLSTCEQYATYMQVNYTCVPHGRLKDICEESEVTTWQGYISSPDYPSLYPSDTRCQCSLKTQDRSILLTILDFALNTSGGSGERCEEDRLHIEGWGDMCNPVVPEGIPETLGLREQALTLTMQTDGRREGRGFWLEFRGSNSGKVTMVCGQRPPDRTTFTDDIDFPPDNVVERLQSTSSDNESTAELEESLRETHQETTDNNVVLVDDGDPYIRSPPRRDPSQPPPEEVDNEFDTYDFTDHAEYQLYNVGDDEVF